MALRGARRAGRARASRAGGTNRTMLADPTGQPGRGLAARDPRLGSCAVEGSREEARGGSGRCARHPISPGQGNGPTYRVRAGRRTRTERPTRRPATGRGAGHCDAASASERGNRPAPTNQLGAESAGRKPNGGTARGDPPPSRAARPGSGPAALGKGRAALGADNRAQPPRPPNGRPAHNPLAVGEPFRRRWQAAAASAANLRPFRLRSRLPEAGKRPAPRPAGHAPRYPSVTRVSRRRWRPLC